ncbi:MAG: hypothetical protein U9Q97_06625 [Acidobacteriota bacterium]|nr:hypothetical protein [Acidobacteriota bacterium]
MCGWKQTNHENRVHAKIQATMPVKTPAQPHQGKEYFFKESFRPDLNPLKPLITSGRTAAIMKRLYAAKTIHENGAWLTY